MNRWLIVFCLWLCGCTYRGYDGQVEPADRFLVEARNGAVLGRNSSGSGGSVHSYYSRAEFAAGRSSFHAATETRGPSDLGDDDDEDNA